MDKELSQLVLNTLNSGLGEIPETVRQVLDWGLISSYITIVCWSIALIIALKATHYVITTEQDDEIEIPVIISTIFISILGIVVGVEAVMTIVQINIAPRAYLLDMLTQAS